MEGTVERIVQGAQGQRGTGEQCRGPVEDGEGSKELQPGGRQGRKMNVLSVWYTAQCKSAKGTARGHWLYGAVSDGK